MKSHTIFLILLLILLSKPSIAIYEGTSNADIFIKVYKQRGDFGRFALWHDVAAECITKISIPMNDISLKYFKRHGNENWVERTQKERAELLERRNFHINCAKAASKKSKTEKSVLKEEHDKISKFIENWLPYYPNRFYDYGIYGTYFREQQENAKKEKDFAKVLNLEADAAEMCAAQYNMIPIKNGLKNFEKIRDTYLRHAALLRTLAKQSHNQLPLEARIGKKIRHQKSISNVFSQKKINEILCIAKTDTRLKNLLKDQIGVREYAWFQGFTWTVSFYNQGWGNLAIAIIDDKTGKVTDVLVNEELKKQVRLD